MSDECATISDHVALGAGCYWGTEKFIRKDFQKKFPNAIKACKVGFMSPDPNAMKNPSYDQVCSGRTGHVEVLDITLNEPDKHFEPLIRFFYTFHDPTTKDQQGNDVGSQYASVIFTGDKEQERIAKEVTGNLQEALYSGEFKPNGYFGNKIATEIVPVTEFYPAHEEHQEYLAKNPNGYCNHFIRFSDWPSFN